jgi:hypothetical protein
VDPIRQRQLERNLELQRCFQERLRRLSDLRICALCKHAFVSWGGSNLCSECIWQRGSLEFRNMRRSPSVRRTMVILGRENPSWVSTKTVHPAIPVPNLESVWVHLAIQRTLKEIERSRRDGIWHVHKMPRLLGLKPYPKEQFKGFNCGRPTKDVAFRRAIDNARLP